MTLDELKNSVGQPPLADIFPADIEFIGAILGGMTHSDEMIETNKLAIELQLQDLSRSQKHLFAASRKHAVNSAFIRGNAMPGNAAFNAVFAHALRVYLQLVEQSNK